MRVLLFNTAGVKALKLAYTPDAITLSGSIPAEAQTIEHSNAGIASPDLSDTKEGDTPHVAPAPFPDNVDTRGIEATTITNQTVEAADKTFSETITFAQFKALPGFSDHAQLAVGIDFINADAVVHETFSRSVQTKRREEALEVNHHYIVHILVPSATATSFDDCVLYLQCAEDAFTTNVPFTTLAMGADAVKPKMTIDGPDTITAAGGKFVVSYFWPDTNAPIVGAEVFSEVTAGYVNRQRVHTDATGKATFTVLPMALDKGEKFRLKFGLKHYTGKVQKVIAVS